MVEFRLFEGSHVYIAPDHVESVRPGKGSGNTLSSLITLASGAQHDVLGGTYETAEKLSQRAPLKAQ